MPVVGIDKVALKDALSKGLKTAKWVSVLTPTKYDDVVVAKLEELFENDWAVSLLAYLLTLLEKSPTDRDNELSPLLKVLKLD